MAIITRIVFFVFVILFAQIIFLSSTGNKLIHPIIGGTGNVQTTKCNSGRRTRTKYGTSCGLDSFVGGIWTAIFSTDSLSMRTIVIIIKSTAIGYFCEAQRRTAASPSRTRLGESASSQKGRGTPKAVFGFSRSVIEFHRY